MTPVRFISVLLGAELLPLMRIQPGRGMALLIMAALIVKHAIFQYLPISPPHAAVLHAAAAVTGLYLVAGLFGLARIQALIIPRWDSGRKWLSFGASDKTTLLKIEPVVAFVFVAIAFLAVAPEWGGTTAPADALDAFRRYPGEPVASAITTQGHVFYPFWFYLGFVPVDELGYAVTAYGRRLPEWFHESALTYAMLLPFMAWMGVGLHARWVDWPASPEYLAEQRQAVAAKNPGTLTFTTVEEVK